MRQPPAGAGLRSSSRSAQRFRVTSPIRRTVASICGARAFFNPAAHVEALIPSPPASCPHISRSLDSYALDLPPLESGIYKYEKYRRGLPFPRGSNDRVTGARRTPSTSWRCMPCTRRRGESMTLRLRVIVAVLVVSALAGVSGCTTDSGSSAEHTGGPTAEETAPSTVEPAATPTPEPTEAPTPEPTATPTAESSATLVPELATVPTPRPTTSPGPAPHGHPGLVRDLGHPEDCDSSIWDISDQPVVLGRLQW